MVLRDCSLRLLWGSTVSGLGITVLTGVLFAVFGGEVRVYRFGGPGGLCIRAFCNRMPFLEDGWIPGM